MSSFTTFYKPHLFNNRQNIWTTKISETKGQKAKKFMNQIGPFRTKVRRVRKLEDQIAHHPVQNQLPAPTTCSTFYHERPRDFHRVTPRHAARSRAFPFAPPASLPLSPMLRPHPKLVAVSDRRACGIPQIHGPRRTSERRDMAIVKPRPRLAFLAIPTSKPSHVLLHPPLIFSSLSCDRALLCSGNGDEQASRRRGEAAWVGRPPAGPPRVRARPPPRAGPPPLPRRVHGVAVG